MYFQRNLAESQRTKLPAPSEELSSSFYGVSLSLYLYALFIGKEMSFCNVIGTILIRFIYRFFEDKMTRY